MTHHRSISRRAFLRMAGLATAGPILAACASPNSSQPTPLTITAKPAQKTLVLAIQSFAHNAMRPVLDAWAARTGHKVELADSPTEGQGLVAQYGPSFQSGTSPVDLLSLSDDAGPIFC